MNTNQSDIRFNSLARSCNDDYCPLMEELCVKMSKLSLKADSKMDAYDAKLEQFFYEEKIDNEIDEKNQETFVDIDETNYNAELMEFNTRYETCLSVEKLEIFKDYIEDKGLKVLDGLDYIQGCHNCDRQLDTFGNEYCNKRCCELVEDYRYPCFRGAECLICYGYPKTTCHWAYNGCDRCDAYDGPDEGRYPISCVNCEKQMTDHEGYLVDDEHYCNLCVVDVFDEPQDPDLCYWMPNCPECVAYSGHWSERYPHSCFHCDKPMTDHEGYWENCTIHCNVCAENLFGLTGHLEEQVNVSKKRRYESEEEEVEISRERMTELTDESCDIWDLALDINHGDYEAALKMIEDQPRLRSHHRVIEYYRAKEASKYDIDYEECSSECSEESGQDDDLQQRKRARVSDDDVIELDISDVDSESDAIVIDLLDDDEKAPNAMVIDLVSDDDENYDGLSNNEDRNWVFTRFIDRNEDDVSEDYDYAESVVDDDEVVEMEEEEVPNQHLYNAMLQMEEENAALRRELYIMRTQRHVLFPEGSSISFTIEGGQRYINIHDSIQHVNNSSMTLDELDGDDDESSCGEEVSCDEEEDNMDHLDMNESV